MAPVAGYVTASLFPSLSFLARQGGTALGAGEDRTHCTLHTANKMYTKYLIGLERRFERRLGKLGVRFKLPFELCQRIM